MLTSMEVTYLCISALQQDSVHVLAALMYLLTSLPTKKKNQPFYLCGALKNLLDVMLAPEFF